MKNSFFQEWIYVQSCSAIVKIFEELNKTEEGPGDENFSFQIGRELDSSKPELTSVLGKVPKWIMKRVDWEYLEKKWGRLELWGH